MTDAEKELLEAAKGLIGVPIRYHSHNADADAEKRFREARRAVAREQLETRLPGWEDQFQTLARSYWEIERKFTRFTHDLRAAGIDVDGSDGLLAKAAADFGEHP